MIYYLLIIFLGSKGIFIETKQKADDAYLIKNKTVFCGSCKLCKSCKYKGTLL